MSCPHLQLPFSIIFFLKAEDLEMNTEPEKGQSGKQEMQKQETSRGTDTTKKIKELKEDNEKGKVKV